MNYLALKTGDHSHNFEYWYPVPSVELTIQKSQLYAVPPRELIVYHQYFRSIVERGTIF